MAILEAVPPADVLDRTFAISRKFVVLTLATTEFYEGERIFSSRFVLGTISSTPLVGTRYRLISQVSCYCLDGKTPLSLAEFGKAWGEIF